MTRDSPRVSRDTHNTRGPPRSRPTSQQSHCLHSPHTQSSSHPLGHSKTRSPHPQKTLHKPSKAPSSSQAHHGPSPLKMVTTTNASQHPPDDAQYYFLPEVNVPNEQHGHAWSEPIVIDDEDLMFSGKSLSAWYEEERQSLSYLIEEEQEEEERRGRQRVRQHHRHQHHQPQQQHHHHHHHHDPHHHHISSSTKNTSGNNDQKRH